MSSNAPASAAAPAASLRAPPFDGQIEAVGRDHAETRDLRDGQIDEHDAARQHLLSERHMRDRDQHARDQRRPQDAEVGEQRVHFSAASSLLRVSSNNPNRSFASGVPPTENGSTTAGACTRSDSQFAGFAIVVGVEQDQLRRRRRELGDELPEVRRGRRHAGLGLDRRDFLEAEPVAQIGLVAVHDDDAHALERRGLRSPSA